MKTRIEFEPSKETAPTSVDVDTPSDVVETEKLSALAKEKARPDVSEFPIAIGDDGRRLFRVGERIIVERTCASFLKNSPTTYLDTRVYVVEAVDDFTGDMKLWNEELCQWALDNYITGPSKGHVYRLAFKEVIVTKGRRKKGKKTPAPKKDPNAPKKQRGRPKGSKNRPKEVVAAEKKAKYEERAAKKAARAARKIKKY
jgi:hypothetical protein